MMCLGYVLGKVSQTSKRSLVDSVTNGFSKNFVIFIYDTYVRLSYKLGYLRSTWFAGLFAKPKSP